MSAQTTIKNLLKTLKPLLKKIKFFSLVIILFFLVFNPNAKFISADQTVEDLNKAISEKREEIKKLEESSANLEKEIQEKQNEQRNLENQIGLLDKEIAKAESEIKKTELEIAKIELEIKGVDRKIKTQIAEIEDQKKVLSEYLRVIRQYDSKSPIELFFGFDSFSKFLDQAEYLETLENKGQETLDKIQKLKGELQWQKRVLEAKNEKLSELRDTLSSKKENLDGEKQSKDRLLEVTKQQEEKYQQLLEESKKDYEQTNSDISSLETEIERKLAEQVQNKSKPEDYKEYTGKGNLSWPVSARRISAYFMDPSYTRYFGVPHYGIDIPTAQGSIIRAPADGYVVKYRNAGFGYSYVLLHHGGGLSTVYGHVLAALVAEGSYVKKSDPIAKSGGAPGTLGAGWMTTGPHLHFETRVNGSAVNPFNFLSK